MSVLKELLYPEEKGSKVGTVLFQVQDSKYIVVDSSNQRYIVESSTHYKVGQTVLFKNSIILRSIKSNLQYTHHVV